MSNLPGGDSAAAAIHAAFAVLVSYTGAGLTGGEVPAVRADVAADVFQGPGSTLRQTSFEIRMDDLPGLPAKGDQIEDAAGAMWLVIDKTTRLDVDAYVLIVEAQP